MRSDVFENFIKIAQEKGLISKENEEAKKKLEKTHRADSLDVSTIEALYGVKPDSDKNLEYENNIMEVAHPTSTVVSPSYDKLNGLFENEIERQNILLHIINKTPDGLSTQKKYAEQELIRALVRTANHLDNTEKDELRTFADLCLIQASNLNKKANPLLIGIAASAAILLGGIYLKNHLRFVSDGFEQDFHKLTAEIDDLITANQSTQTQLGAGYSFKPAFIQEMSKFKSILTNYFNIYKKIEPVISKLEVPRTASELLELAKKPEGTEAIQAYKSFQEYTAQIMPYIEKVEQNFDNEDYKGRQIEEKGTFMKLLDAPQVLHGGKGLVADDFDDVFHALKTFVVDIQKISQILENAQAVEQGATQEIQSTMSSEPEKQPEKPQSPASVADVDEEVDGLSDLLEGDEL